MFHMNDDRDYSEVVEGWVRQFISTMDEGILYPGNDSGDTPFGVKIIFDGYAEKAAQKDPQPEINLRADKSVKYEYVAQVLAASRRAGLTKLGFVTEPN
jgi:hypothetical protein